MAVLELTYVLYDDSSWLSLALALVTLSPILLMASYAALAVYTREYIILVMWTGQFANEGFNYVLKHSIRQDRPDVKFGDGYGFPSSHSQYMAYFSAFLLCHLYFRHRFLSTGSTILDAFWRSLVYLSLVFWAGAVAYSRYYLQYHNKHQILWGLAIGAAAGVVLYVLAEVIPTRRPLSMLGRFKTFLLTNPVSTWFRLRDGWAVWSDGGHEEEWMRWRIRWDQQRKLVSERRKEL